MLKIKFWWNGYDPAEALESFDCNVSELRFEVKPAKGWWRAAKAGSTLADVKDYMIDKGYAVTSTKMVTSKRVGGWRALYILTIGRAQ